MASTQTIKVPSDSSDFDLERRLLQSSGLFDDSYYVHQAGQESARDPISHYLREGWLQGIEPNSSFPGATLRPYFSAIGVDQPPAVTWLLQSSSGRWLPSKWGEAEWLAHEVRGSGFFDEDFYRRHIGSLALGLDLALHYVIVGEGIGYAPCKEFDPGYYVRRYPDLIKVSSLLLHYAKHGKKEGRLGGSIKVGHLGLRAHDAAKDNVLLVVHDTSRTGAPILGWNIAGELAETHNVFTVHLGGGDLTEHFARLSTEVYGPFQASRRHPLDIEYAIRDLIRSQHFSYAIANSAEARALIQPLILESIPTILLMHEFASCLAPACSLQEAFDWSTEIVFPARIVARAAEDIHPALKHRHTHILPQGVSLLPPGDTPKLSWPPVEDDTENYDESIKVSESDRLDELEKITRTIESLKKITQDRNENGTFIIVGAGYVHFRKGVDLFLAIASVVVKAKPARKFHFLWVGDGFNPEHDKGYSVYLDEQVNRSSLKDHVTFLDAVTQLEPVYAIADAFLLSSRLDPLPNVTIDAAVRGIPVVCFDDASGMAELMQADPETASGVVDYLDSDAAAKLILQLASDSELHAGLSEGMRNLAHRKFDMQSYVAKLNALGVAATERMKTRFEDLTMLTTDSTFDQDIYLGMSGVMESRRTTIGRHLALVAARGWTTPAEDCASLRRPCPGFNPYAYAAAHSSRLSRDADPLADFVRQGKPAGPWLTKVLQPGDFSSNLKLSFRLRVALHAHFYYPELAEDLLWRIQFNCAPCDLFVSTDDVEKAELLKRTFAAYSAGSVDIRVVPNKGRDIGPLLTGFAQEMSGYDLIGHVHGKRSLVVGDRQVGEVWREFLLQNLIGRLYPMMDQIIFSFEGDDSLGLVFPCDPGVIAWSSNLPRAIDLAARMGWTGPLPAHFDFPVGTMFWARRQALAPLLDLRLRWEDFPDEPVPYDGTILHAIERLLPFACQLAGFSHAVTHIPGVSR